MNVKLVIRISKNSFSTARKKSPAPAAVRPKPESSSVVPVFWETPDRVLVHPQHQAKGFPEPDNICGGLPHPENIQIMMFHTVNPLPVTDTHETF
jgi:hypothetical protein